MSPFDDISVEDYYDDEVLDHLVDDYEQCAYDDHDDTQWVYEREYE